MTKSPFPRKRLALIHDLLQSERDAIAIGEDHNFSLDDLATWIAHEPNVRLLTALGKLGDLQAHLLLSRYRLAAETDCYFQMTDAEIATRIAGELGLVPRVEATSEVHARIERRGDPLRFLRGRADRAGRVLAITAGMLWPVRALPPSSELAGLAPRRLTLDSALLALETEDRGEAGRCGWFEVPFDGGWRPLLEVDIAVSGASWDGRSRVVRCAHTIDADGGRTRIEFVQERQDGSLPELDSGPAPLEVSEIEEAIDADLR